MKTSTFEHQLRFMVVADAIVIAIYAAAAGLNSPGLPLVTILVMLAVIAQITYVMRPRRQKGDMHHGAATQPKTGGSGVGGVTRP
ncbi:hypothetical protein [Plantibacter sp. VKM Ac-2876]|uniref:hypothetical protein n=1 Tax=Plantibacter sp. VKM Ac-2876 TaxID=2783826 RepID=UPI00188C5FBC|nr:hypothetical protein [Plantibacter sp. VKM Ac-2876]MBF4567038.1 hypothetical protein [Plantibacter sp. VKM Ac-2876]